MIAIMAKLNAIAFSVVSSSVESVIMKIAEGIIKLSFADKDVVATPSSLVQYAIMLKRNRNPAPMITVIGNHGAEVALVIASTPPASAQPKPPATA